jgi:Zn-dependent protease with chaperone function
MARRNRIGTIALVIVLFAILAAAGWYASEAFTAVDGPPMPAVGYLAMGLSILFSLIVGIGLMALVFYSSRHGYDEPYRADEDQQ